MTSQITCWLTKRQRKCIFHSITPKQKVDQDRISCGNRAKRCTPQTPPKTCSCLTSSCQEKHDVHGRKSFVAVNIKSPPRPLFFSCTRKVTQLYVPQCAMCWYERTRACYNALLVFCGQEEPGSAPVTQLLMALVLLFGLTSPTCLLVLFAVAYLLRGMSPLELPQPK